MHHFRPVMPRCFSFAVVRLLVILDRLCTSVLFYSFPVSQFRGSGLVPGTNHSTFSINHALALVNDQVGR
jgi:hypothetical protein